MALFTLNSDITIGNFSFSGVDLVRISRSIHSVADTAVIRIPAICKVKKGINVSGYQSTGALINDRDPVTISLGYNGQMQTEFQGFVKRRSLGMPLQLECEGFVQVLRLDIDVNNAFATTSAAQLLEFVKTDYSGAPTGINVVVANDIPLLNVVLPHVNGVALCSAIRRFSQGALNLFFINPTTLWCGSTYVPYKNGTDPFGIGTVNYRLGYNCIKDNALVQRTPSDPVQIVFQNTNAIGITTKVESAADLKYISRKAVSVLNNIGDPATMQLLANEKMYQANYAGYMGTINGFLQPYCQPGWLANVVDDRYPERNGSYLVESTEVVFGNNGAQRRVELGPKLGFSI